MNPTTITNALGETRPVSQHYQDGSWTCPFCSAPTLCEASGGTGRCANPGCTVGNPTHAAKLQADHDRHAAERAEREWLHRVRSGCVRGLATLASLDR